MVTEWWQLSEEQLAENAEAQVAKQVAYWNTFYGRDESREVLLDIQRRCYSHNGSSDAILALIELFNDIRANCGASLVSEKAAIDAEAGSITVGES